MGLEAGSNTTGLLSKTDEKTSTAMAISDFVQLVVGLSPNAAEVAIASTDYEGNPGLLNEMVMEDLGYLSNSLPGRDDMQPGYYWLKQKKKKGVLLVATVGQEDSQLLLKENLTKGLIAHINDFKGKRWWV